MSVQRTDKGDVVEYETVVKDRRKFMQLLAGTGGIAALAGCAGGEGGDSGGGSTNTSNGEDDSDTETVLRVGITAEPWNLDPALHTDVGSALVDTVIYDEVIGLTPDSELTPELATELAQGSDDGTVWEFSLREGVMFHNGDEMTAEDLKYTFDWIANPDNNAAVLGYAPQLEGAETEVLGDYQLRLTLSEPNSLWNTWMTRAIEGVVPKGSRGDLSDAKGPKGIGTDLTTNPIGTGPFKFEEWQSGSHLTLSAFEDHWRDGPPYVDRMRFEFIPESSTRISRLRSDNLDMINRVPAKDFESLQNAPETSAESIPGRRTITNYFNHNPTAYGEENPVANVHNRRAVHYATDAEEVLRSVFQNQGVVQKGPWFPDSEWTSPNLKDMQMYDPEKAQAELEMGPNPDGFSMTTMVENNSTFRQLGTILQDQLSDIGIELEVQSMDSSTLFSRLYGTSRWHMATANWFQSIGSVFWWLFAGFAPQRNHNNWHHGPADENEAWEPNGPAPPESAQDEFGTGPGSGHEWYRARTQQAFSTTNEETQKEIAFELQEYIVDKVIQSDMAYVNRIEAWRDDISDYQMGRFAAEYRTARHE